MGVNTQQNDYYESLFRRTTASYRAKIDTGNDNRGSSKRKSFDSNKPTSSRQAAVENRKIFGERYHGETFTSSYDVLESSNNQTQARNSKGQAKNKVDETKTDKQSIKALIEDTLTQVLRDKYSQLLGQKENKTPVKSIVEQVLKEKLSDLRHPTRERFNSSEPGSLRSIIEDIVTQVLQEKMASLEKESAKSKVPYKGLENLNQDLHQKLHVSKEKNVILQREPVAHYTAKKSLDSQVLVQQLMAAEDVEKNHSQNKNLKKADKENSAIPPTAGCIKRLQRSPRKNPEWQDPRPNDNIFDKPQRALRTRSPAATSSARSGRSKCSSSVLIRRPVSQGRNNKPNSDPVALYQYYKNEWDHFRQQIPGESPHNRLRWHVRQRLLDPE